MCSWNITSIDSLSLFDKLTLDSGQLKQLSPHIYKNILKGYSALLDRMHQFDHLDQLRFSVETGADGTIWFKCNGGEKIQAGRLDEFKPLLKAMRQAHDEARILFPAAFREAPVAGKVAPAKTSVSPPSVPTVVEQGLDANSFVRNSVSAWLTTHFGAVATLGAKFVAASGAIAGCAHMWAGGSTAFWADKNYVDASLIDDEEGKTQSRCLKVLGAIRSVMGTVQLSGSMITVFRNIIHLPVSVTALKTLPYLGVFGDVCTIVTSLIIAGLVAREWPLLSQFRTGLQFILKRDSSQQEKALEGIEFLRQQLTLTAEDLGKIADEGLVGAAKEQAIENKLAEKRERLSRRIGGDLVNRIREEGEDLIEGLKTHTPGTLNAAKELIAQADKESFKKRVEQITLLVVAILMIAGTIAAYVFAGPASPILFAVNAFFWLSLDSAWLHEKMGGAFYALNQLKTAKIWDDSQMRLRPDFWRQMEAEYLDAQEAWNLVKLKDNIERDIERMNYVLNGKSVKDFASCLEGLGLTGLDFTRTHYAPTTPKQKKALRWLTTVTGNVVADPCILCLHDFPGHTSSRSGQTNVDAHYNRETGEGSLQARVEACVAPLLPSGEPDIAAAQQVTLQIDVQGNRVQAGWKR